MKTPKISILIVSFNNRQQISACLGAILKASETVSLEILLVDNASGDGSANLIAKDFPAVKLIRNETNLGFAAAVNQAAQIASGRYLVLVNPDALLSPDSLRVAVEKMEGTPKAGVGGGLLISLDGVPQPSGRLFPSLLNQFLTLSGLASKYPKSRFFGRVDRTWANSNQSAKVDWIPGAFAIIRKDVFDRLGGFDERFFLYYEEVDLCRRMRQAGYEVWYWPDIKVAHEGGVSARSLVGHFSEQGSQLTLWNLRSQFLYFRKHHGFIIAWFMKSLIMGWYSARTVLRDKDPEKKKKSLEQMELIARAWTDTQGGTVCPPKPWR